jgi:hypothetical protein
MATVRLKDAVPEPSDHHRSSFAQTSWDVELTGSDREYLEQAKRDSSSWRSFRKRDGIDTGRVPVGELQHKRHHEN